MGRMYFPGEKVREYLPPRKSGEDIVAKFGAWLTGEGAGIIAYIVCAIPAIGGLWDLLKWLLGNFQENIFIGLVSIIGAIWMVCFAIIPLYILYIVAYAAAWALGWVCYNKWTLLAGLFLVMCFFVVLRVGLTVKTQNRWDTENGWEFIDPDTSDLTVSRKPVQVRCDPCRGTGYVVQEKSCYSCNGRGWVPNPAAQVGQTINDVGRILGGGRGMRPVPRIPQMPSEIHCSSCNGVGHRQQRNICDRCGGSGSIYR